MRTPLNEKGTAGTKARLYKQNKKLGINDMLQAIFRSIGLPPRRVDPTICWPYQKLGRPGLAKTN